MDSIGRDQPPDPMRHGYVKRAGYWGANAFRQLCAALTAPVRTAVRWLRAGLALLTLDRLKAGMRRGARWLAVAGLFLCYLTLNTEGLRAISSAAARRLATTPFLAILDDFEGFAELQVAHILVVLLFAASLWAAQHLIYVLMTDRVPRPLGFTLNPAVYREVVVVLGLLAILTDGVTFYCGMFGQGASLLADDETAASIGAVFVTGGYVLVLLFVAFWGVHVDLKLETPERSNA